MAEGGKHGRILPLFFLMEFRDWLDEGVGVGIR